MKRKTTLFLAALGSLAAGFLALSALAADAPKPPAPVEPPSATVAMTQQEIMVAAGALANAGAACDAGVAVYCQIATLRSPLTVKLQTAGQQLAAPAKKP